MDSRHIVIVDDELPNLESLQRVLKSDGATVTAFQDPQAALSYLRKHSADVVITDLRMEQFSGMDLLEAIRLLDPTIEVIVITAYGTVEVAVEAMKKGAYDFITKPLQRVDVLRTLHRAYDKRKLATENLSLREELRAQVREGKKDLIGRSPALRQMLDVAGQAARSRASVLIEGESGTGKGLLAEYLHYSNELTPGLFVKINCAAIPDNLLEAELFGYEPGAFTGATKRKKGRVELAEGGTLFLDEIGSAPLTLQSKLLRFLQDGEFERLGSNETLKVHTRVISATNSDLKSAIRNNLMREDLYYRLNVIHIQVPPLRDRVEDIPMLAQKFVEESARKNGRATPLISSSAMDCLLGYRWPGNIRELQNLMERAVVLSRTGTISPEDLPTEISGSKVQRSLVIPLGIPLREIDRMVMDETLKVTRGDKRLAAKLLGVHQRTIYRHLGNTVTEEEPLPPPNPLPFDKEVG